jgi:transcriptional regulator with XRE-family HTH domain
MPIIRFTENPEAIGPLLRNHRKHNGLTQAQVAQELGVSVVTIGRWEHGKTPGTLSAYMNLARYIGLTRWRIGDTVIDLVTGKEQPYNPEEWKEPGVE